MTGDDPAEVAFRLVASLRTPDHEILTLLAGADASSEETNRLAATLTERFDDLEIEVHRGDQPDPLYLLGLE